MSNTMIKVLIVIGIVIIGVITFTIQNRPVEGPIEPDVIVIDPAPENPVDGQLEANNDVDETETIDEEVVETTI